MGGDRLRVTLFLALSLLVCEYSVAQSVQLKTLGDEKKIGYGQLVTVTARNAATAKWLVRPRDTKFQSITTDDNHPAVVFSSGCQSGTFVVVCAALDENGMLLDLLEEYVDVGGPAPPPRPDPDNPDPPGPGPAPTPPDAQLASLARSQTAALQTRAKGQAGQVAAVFENAATAVVALQTPEQAKNLVRQGNADAIGDNRAEWIDWMKTVGKYFDQLRNEGKLPDAKSYAPYYRSVAIGMQQVLPPQHRYRR